MAALTVWTTYTTGRTVRFQVRQLSSAGVPGDYWDDVAESWTATPTSNAEQIVMAETTATGYYQGTTSASALGTYTGKAQVLIKDIDDGKFPAGQMKPIDLVNGSEVDVVSTTKSVLDAVVAIDGSVATGLEKAIAQTVSVYISKSDGQPATAGVSSTRLADAAPTPAFVNATNAASYSGTAGFYNVLLTAAETNKTSIIVKVTLSDGSIGELLIVFGSRQIEADWADGGRLDLLLDSAISKIDTVDTVVDSILLDTAAIDAATKSGGTLFDNVAQAVSDIATVDGVVDAILLDTAAIDTSLQSGGTIYDLIDAIDTGAGTATAANQTTIIAALTTIEGKVDTVDTVVDTVLVDTDAIDTTLKSGGTIHTMIGNIDPGSAVAISPIEVSKARTWIIDQEGTTARNVITLTSQDDTTLAVDFSEVLNPDTTISTASSVVEISSLLTAESIKVAQDRKTVHFDITESLSAHTEYRFRVTATTTDGQTIGGIGILKVSN